MPGGIDCNTQMSKEMKTKEPKVLYSKIYNSYCYLNEQGMYVNDGKVKNADFWGLEKAANNYFCPVKWWRWLLWKIF